MSTIQINSLQEFHDQIVSTREIHPIFRGESKATFTLHSKFGRHAIKNPENTKKREEALLDEFKRLSVPYISYDPKNDWEWMALAQHHGLATRLLDWTLNPLVAAHFACMPPYSEDSVIYVLDEYSLPNADLKTSPYMATKNHILRPRHTDSRITSQAGLFTVHNNPLEAFEHPQLTRWLLKQSMLTNLSVMLETYGITNTFIFPGLDSLCLDIHQNYLY